MRLILVGFLLTYSSSTYSQCADLEKVQLGGEFGHHNYITYCPAYCFSVDGTNSKKWDILCNPRSIDQVPLLMEVKKSLESKIIEYSGMEFFSKLKFYNVEVSYPDSLAKFNDRHPKPELEKCKAKYFFYYYFTPFDGIKHCVGFALDNNGKIVSELMIPSQANFAPINHDITACEALNIAKKTNPNIEPIKAVRFEYDIKSNRYFWEIIQEIMNPKEGKNQYYRVTVDASNPKIVQSSTETALIVF